VQIFNLEGKKVLVTGASSGIGRGIALLLSNLGAQLVITGRNTLKLQECYNQLSGTGHAMVTADLILEEDLDTVVNSVDSLDGVVFCAGIIDYQPVKFVTKNKIAQIFDVNFNSPVLLTQKLLKHKKIKKQSSLVYISSLSSKLGIAGTSLYAASKAALSGFAKVLALELSGQKIRVNAISPGIIKTPMFETGELAITQEAMDEAEKAYPLGYGQVEDVSSYVAFLLSDNARWITGTDHILDGGFTLS
jgi:NAD(P)-dependent dehydrogenase (short-subunit alcohol dehydrogenase family)